MKNAWLLIFFCFSGCGYHFGIQPEAIRPPEPIAIPVFENLTFEPLLEKQVHEVFKETFMARGWSVVGDPDQAPTVLSGKITHFERMPISLNLQSQAQEYRVKVGLAFSLREQGKPAASAKREAEGVSEYIARLDPAEDRAAEDRAIREAGRRLAERVADLLSEEPPPPPSPALQPSKEPERREPEKK